MSPNTPKFKMIAPMGASGQTGEVSLSRGFLTQNFAHASSQNHTADFYAVLFFGCQSRVIAFLEG